MGRAHVAGSTWSGDLPAVNALQPSLGGHPVFRTTDGGDSWLGSSTGLRTRGVTAFAIDPGSPETVYAGTVSEGLFKSVDGGTTWTCVTSGLQSSGLQSLEVYALAIGDGAPAAVYAATNYGVLRTQDAGENWAVLYGAGWVTTLAVAPGLPSTLYAGVLESPSGVLMSTDAGETWSHGGLSEGIVGLTVSGSTVYAATASTVYTSTPGSGWVEVNLGQPSQINTVAADPVNPSVAYAGTFDGSLQNDDSWRRSGSQ